MLESEVTTCEALDHLMTRKELPCLAIHMAAIIVLGLQLLIALKAVGGLTEPIGVPECVADRSATVRLQHGANGIAHHEHGLGGWVIKMLGESLQACPGTPTGLWGRQLRGLIPRRATRS